MLQLGGSAALSAKRLLIILFLFIVLGGYHGWGYASELGSGLYLWSAVYSRVQRLKSPRARYTTEDLERYSLVYFMGRLRVAQYI